MFLRVTFKEHVMEFIQIFLNQNYDLIIYLDDNKIMTNGKLVIM